MRQQLVVTGASAGIGAAAAVELTRQGHEVLALGRSREKLARVYARMSAVAPEGMTVPEPLCVDLASLAETRRAAEAIRARCERLDVLVNNAGVQPTRRQLSPDGFELTLAVNHLAPFLMTNLLADVLRSNGGRVVTTASSNHATGELDLSDLQLESDWTSRKAYDRSKLANVLFTVELRRRAGIPASSFHPGSISTDLNRDSRMGRLTKPVERLVYGKPEKGADTLVWLATSAEGGDPSGPYYADRAPAEASERATDPALAAELWRVSEELVALNGHRP